MKICFVAPSCSSHTQKWAWWFKNRGHDITVISFDDIEIKGIRTIVIQNSVNAKGGDLQKLAYLLKGHQILKCIKEIQPDIINVHYATSYGAAVALSGIKKYTLSVWGADIYDFPQKSLLHRNLLKFSLMRSTDLMSTSKAMAKEAEKYTNKAFTITPFGVDTELFNPEKRNRTEDGLFVVGTVKTLTPKYGIDTLLYAVAIVREKQPDIPIRLRIAGSGTHEKEYKELSCKLKIDDITTWLGYIPMAEAAIEWANMDVAIIASTLESESFGVSAVEAESCGTPVIISDIPGLMEATSPEKSSIVVKRKDVNQLADAIIKLFYDETLRRTMGKNGRRYVIENYEINKCFSEIEEHFETLLKVTR